MVRHGKTDYIATLITPAPNGLEEGMARIRWDSGKMEDVLSADVTGIDQLPNRRRLKPQRLGYDGSRDPPKHRLMQLKKSCKADEELHHEEVKKSQSRRLAYDGFRRPSRKKLKLLERTSGAGDGLGDEVGNKSSDDGGGKNSSNHGGGMNLYSSNDWGGNNSSDDDGGNNSSDDGGGKKSSDDKGGMNLYSSDDGGGKNLSDDKGGKISYSSDDERGMSSSDDGGGKISSKRNTKEAVAGAALKNIPGVESDEVDTALEETGPPFGLQTAMKKVYNLRQTRKSLVGFKVRKFFVGKEFHGEVVGEPRLVRVLKRSFRGHSTELVNNWPVEYEDYDKEDMTYDELLRWSADRPPLVATCRGRSFQMLELFCGSAIVTSEFAHLKWETDSIDVLKESNATIVKDILKLEYTDLRFVPDCIWASLPCETYSVAAGNYHRSTKTDDLDKSQKARQHNFIFLKMTKLMAWAKENHPHLIVVIENPVGTLQKMPLMQEFIERFGLYSVTVNYCAFGRDEKKPTMIWTNDFGLKSSLQEYTCEKKCKYYGRNAKHILQVNDRTHDCSVIPQPLAEEVAEYINAKFVRNRIRKIKAAVLTSFD